MSWLMANWKQVGIAKQSTQQHGEKQSVKKPGKKKKRNTVIILANLRQKNNETN